MRTRFSEIFHAIVRNCDYFIISNHKMGRRKKAVKKAVKRKRPVVATTFKCIFCHQDKTVQCSLNHKSMTGQLLCTACRVTWTTKINSLSEPIDVFTEWLDETMKAQENAVKRVAARAQGLESSAPVAAASDNDDEEEDD